MRAGSCILARCTMRAVVFDLFGTLIDDSPPADYGGVPRRDRAGSSAPTPSGSRELWHGDRRRSATRARSRTCFGSDLRRARRRRLLAGADARGSSGCASCSCPGRTRSRPSTELRRRGFRLGMICNASSELSALWAESAFEPHFDAVLFSADERMMKPDRRLYERMAELLGVATGRVRLRRRRRLPRAAGRRGRGHDAGADPRAVRRVGARGHDRLGRARACPRSSEVLALV